MEELQVRSFAAACMITAAGYEPKRVEILDDGMPVFVFDDAAGAVYQRFHQVKSLLRHAEMKANDEKEASRKVGAR
jgi:hypothetical protein